MGIVTLIKLNYRTTNFNPVTFAAGLGGIFQEYRDLSMRHIFSRIVVHADVMDLRVVSHTRPVSPCRYFHISSS
jgi:hypothetical protein